MKVLMKMAVLVAFSMSTLCFAEADKDAKETAVKTANAGKAIWMTSFADAKAEAAKRKVPILADFSGSDWCGWCIKLDKEVFSTELFKEYAAGNLVLLLVDFPRQSSQSEEIKKQNNDLVESFKIEGFPTVLLLDAEGKLLGRTSYLPGGAESYVTHLKKLLKNK